MNTNLLWKKGIVLFLVSVLLTIVFQGPTDAIGEGKIYWTEWNKIRRANLDGTDVEDVVTDLGVPWDLTLDPRNGKMYWTEDLGSLMKRANLDGTNSETIHDIDDEIGAGKFDFHRITCMAIDSSAKKIYWAGIFIRKFYRSNLDGTNIEGFLIDGIFTSPENIDIAQNGKKIYWMDFMLPGITRTNLNGTEIERLVNQFFDSGELVVDEQANKIYWIDVFQGRILQSSLNGDNIEDTVTGLRFPVDFALDTSSRKIYWLQADKDVGKSKIGSANLDGTDVIDVLTDLEHGTSLDILLPGAYDVMPDEDKLTTTWANIKTQ